MLTAMMKLGWRFLSTASPRQLLNMTVRCGLGNLLAIRRFQKGLKRGKVFPPFLFLSITSRCNLRCQGCWVAVDKNPPGDLSMGMMDRIVRTAKSRGCRFFGILGGEPLLHPQFWEILSTNRDCYFQLFTNGMNLGDKQVQRLAAMGNVTPLISIEGNMEVSDIRRGGTDVHARGWAAIKSCKEHGLVTGVATSLCQSNIDDLLTEDFLDHLIDRGVLYMWYYIYRPTGADPCRNLALTPEQIHKVRKFIVEKRCQKPIMLIDAYWDHLGRPMCPAAVGISHHVNPWGDIEPCPPIQFAAENINDGDIGEVIENSSFLADFRKTAASTTRGCILMDHPQVLAGFLRESDTKATSRRAGIEEIAAIGPLPSHGSDRDYIPEKNPFYKFAKKHWFFGFGAYG